MSELIDLTGKKFGRWTVLYYDEEKSRNSRHTYWVCQCSCEDETIRSVRGDSLGKVSMSCGCIQKEIASMNFSGNQYAKKYNKYDLSGEYGIGYTSKGESFYFDLEDYDKIKNYCWNISPYGYVVCANINGKKTTLYMQRVILGNVGKHTKIQIDHINHNKNDNRKINLRICTASQNSMNSKLRKDNTSGVTGVYYYKPRDKWVAMVSVDGNLKHLGYFDTFEEAVIARKEAEEKYFGEYSYDNSMYNANVILGA